MGAKLYRMRSVTHQDGEKKLADLDLEFDGKRAFAVVDSICFGNYRLKARLEIDPTLLMRSTEAGCDFFYRGKLILPMPQHN